MTQIRIIEEPKDIGSAALVGHTHLLLVVPAAKSLAQLGEVPLLETLRARLTRRRMKPDELRKTPLGGDLEHGAMAVWIMCDPTQSVFERHTAMRKAVHLLLAEQPREIAVIVSGDETQRRVAAETAIYAGLLNGAPLPARKKKDHRKPLQKLSVFGHKSADGYRRLRAIAAGNTLARELTMLPANELAPAQYRERIRELAAEEGWEHEEYDFKKLRKIGAGAFVAVAQGSDDGQAAIVHLRHSHPLAKKTFALVGKGICFDTGGHNLKPARYMHGMHEDMNGSAVALGILLAACWADLPVNLDVWLALAQNHISPKAYKQNEVVTALNGTTIEVVHTDAEGRMVLADTLTLAAREKPDAMIDFATLTGSMDTALGSRYSGIFSNREALLEAALAAGKSSGERVNPFPLDADYEEELESEIADIKQCTLDGEADHILAARFLMRFIAGTPWLHMDLSASNNKGGLGAVGSDVTGFGVAWGTTLLEDMTRKDARV